MHVQLGSRRDGADVSEVRGRRTPIPRALLLVPAVWAAVLGAACHDRAADAAPVLVAWETRTEPLVVGQPAVAELTLRDRQRQPILGAQVDVQAFMAHPGMAPVVVRATERGDGVYRVRLQFTMAGDWIAMVRGVLPDGRTLADRIAIGNVRPEG